MRYHAKQGGKGRHVMCITTYPPQQCGIATFSRDLVTAIAAHNETASVSVCAVSDSPGRYRFPVEVVGCLARDDRPGYRKIANAINASDAEAVSVQHEFGIFGGDEGGYLLDLLAAITKPVVTTLHTVLSNPTPAYHTRLRQVIDASDAVVVLTPFATRILSEQYGVPDAKVHVIAHGIPDVPFAEPAAFAERLGVGGRMVIMTFGLIGRNKGIEEMIEAMPAIVARHPEALYMIVGATHPAVIAAEGESYRHALEANVAALGLSGHVTFHNHYLSNSELRDYLGACTIYVTPYPNREQISSGTLAYAVGMGKAVVSTPYWYARDLLANGRGALVEFASPTSLATTIIDLIQNTEKRDRMRRNAFEFGRGMRWASVADAYMKLFAELRPASRVDIPMPLRPKALLLTGAPGLDLRPSDRR